MSSSTHRVTPDPLFPADVNLLAAFAVILEWQYAIASHSSSVIIINLLRLIVNPHSLSGAEYIRAPIRKIMRTAEISFEGMRWRPDYEINQSFFCTSFASKVRKSLLGRVSTGSGSDLVSDQHAIFLIILDSYV